MNENQDVYWMSLALEEAKIAASLGEVPVGAVLVQDNQVLSKAYNVREMDNKISGHAEIQVLELAGQQSKTWRFPQATLYVTVEPCLMCLGAILQAHVQRIVFGTRESKTGAVVSTLQLNKIPNARKITVVEGVLETQISNLMKSFFGEKRES
jgi:tRNA(adenine34) deaminase